MNRMPCVIKNLKKLFSVLLLTTIILALSSASPVQAAKVTVTAIVGTSQPELSPAELWNFTAANMTAHATSLVWGSPVVASGIAYVWNTETYINPDEPHVPLLNIPVSHMLVMIYALNESSGAKLWNFSTPGIDSSLDIVAGVLYVAASDPLFTDGKSAGGNISALDAATGAQKWVYNIDGQIIWSSINDGVIYVFFHASGFNSYVCAVSLSDGKELWRWNAGFYVFLSNPDFDGDVIYFGTFGSGGNNLYYAVSAVNGTVLWSAAADGSVRGSSSVVNGVVYFNSDNTSFPVNNTYTYICALNAQNGDKLWNYPVGYIVRSSPIVDGGIVYVDGREATLTDPNTLHSQLVWGTSTVFALNASKGDKIWNYSANDTDFWSLSLVDGVTCFGNSNGTINVLNASNGVRIWSSSTLGDGRFTISDGVMYYYSGDTFHALDTSNGNSLLSYVTVSNLSFLAIANSAAFFDADNTVYALSILAGLSASTSPIAPASPSSIASPSTVPPVSPTRQPTIEPSATPNITQENTTPILITIGLVTVVVVALLAYVAKRRDGSND